MSRVVFRSKWLLLAMAALCWNLAAGQIGNDRTASSELVTATNRFGFALLRQLWKQDRDANIFYSPLSMTQALSMAYNGAAAGTQREMRRALGFERLSLDEINQSSAALLKELAREDAGLKLTIANSLWTRQGMQLSPDFLARNQKFYRADIAALDFDNPGSAATINNWVARRTNGKIPAIVEKLERDDVLVLINAVYFKGAWAHPFYPSKTSNEVFYLQGRVQTQVRMMNQRERLPCYDGDSVRAVSLPYGNFGAQMVVFLPDEGVSITELLQTLDYDSYRRWRQSFQD
jgi:serine protease inhibitor